MEHELGDLIGPALNRERSISERAVADIRFAGVSGVFLVALYLGKVLQWPDWAAMISPFVVY